MNEKNTYDGNTNYETWAVNLWLNNEEWSYRYWREEARRIRDRGQLAQRLKDELNEDAPDLGSTLWADLLNAALSEVDWDEVAESFLEGIPDDEDEDDEPEEEAPEEITSSPQPTPIDSAGKFPLGQVVATPNALEQFGPEEVARFLGRHHAGDWGDCGPDDREENELSLREGFRLFSVYHSAKGDKCWVITEADRSATTVLLPEDY